MNDAYKWREKLILFTKLPDYFTELIWVFLVQLRHAIGA